MRDAGEAGGDGRAAAVAEAIDFAAMDDTALLDWRAAARARLELLPPRSPGHVRLTFIYHASTIEVTERARVAWARQR